eukprot:TRINITY_DN97242_c0_g1_i1.p3 TRINITY_DN97242_c0_g1~~TRINITY_DN97242_c0_g1_i1.p3  ORF type:complete len:152 (-),score=10.58 TRINITY_DN97242_c0_g1_i1:91-546(-)
MCQKKQTTYQLKFEPSGVVKGDAQNGDGIFQISGFYLKSGDEFNVKIVVSQFQVEIDQETCDFNQESVENVIQKSQFYAIVSFTGECVEKEDECWELPKSLKGTYSSTSKKYGDFCLTSENKLKYQKPCQNLEKDIQNQNKKQNSQCQKAT